MDFSDFSAIIVQVSPMPCVSRSTFRKVIFLLSAGEGNVFIHVCLFTGGGGVYLLLPTEGVPTRGCAYWGCAY